MNNEIKDILNNLVFNVYHTNNWKKPLGLKQETWKQLLDYITYLQQENKKIQQQHLATIDKLIETQERIEKAVEYIKEMDTQLEVYGDYDILSDNKNDLLNILNGRSVE